jgi:hypothetical protein
MSNELLKCREAFFAPRAMRHFLGLSGSQFVAGRYKWRAHSRVEKRVISDFTEGCSTVVVTRQNFMMTMSHQSSSVVPPTPSTICSATHSLISQSFQHENTPSRSPSPKIITPDPFAVGGISDLSDSEPETDDDLSPILESIMVWGQWYSALNSYTGTNIRRPSQFPRT